MGKKWATCEENWGNRGAKKGERKLRKRETKWGQIGDKQRDKKGGKGYLIR